MRSFFTFCLTIFSLSLMAQTVGDTIVVPTFNYSQTSRDTMVEFPDDPGQTYEKIIMLYNMRCKDGLISVSGNTNRGCGEWDYSCNTYITDSSQVDSVINYTSSHSISNFSGETFDYLTYALFDYYQYRQMEVVVNTINSETTATVGTGSQALENVLATDQNSQKVQYLFTQSELNAAGLIAGHIDALSLEVTSGSANADYFRLRLMETNKVELDPNSPDMENLSEVYFRDYAFAPGTNKIQFHTPFIWNGTDNIIIELSFTNHNPGEVVLVEGENTASQNGIFSQNGFSLDAQNGKIDIPATAFSAVTDQLTVSFWSYGDENVQPISNSIVHGRDDNNNRQLNLHLPWGNSSVYFDCGNDGSGYDRIDKGATNAEFEGSWNHWTLTKNATSGEMKIYLNGVLWHSGTDKNRNIDLKEIALGNNNIGSRPYFGKIDEFRFWSKELDEATIQDWMYQQLNSSHPDYANLVAYYKMDEGSGELVADASVHAESATIEDFLFWNYERGSNLARGFVSTTERPNITFAQGDYSLNITEIIVTDSQLINANIVCEYDIVPRYGTMLHDSVRELSVNEFWQEQYEHTYDPEGIAIDSVFVEGTESIEIEELSYFKRYPSKFEIMSFVTPYGINLDLGMEGKTWAFDVTDYTPVLKGNKRITMERGGQRQEDIDIRFLFVLGTPTHDVLEINQLWRADSKGYQNIIDDKAFEPRDFSFRADGAMFKLRSVITGHGQQGEFTPRHHTFNINGGDVEYDWKLWTECSEIPIYPQGGTWVYDRAGWCPGNPSDIYEFDITEHVTAGQTHTIDYGLVYANGTSNYIVNNQMVTYGEPNFGKDAAVLRILKPNFDQASEERFNPACSFPEVVIQNTGSSNLFSLDFEYWTEGGEKENYTWSGALTFMEQDTVVLPIPQLTFWYGTADRFWVRISNPNGAQDEYAYNNVCHTNFENVDLFPQDEAITVQLKTNNYGYQNSYKLFDVDGNVIFERDDCEDNTVYDDEFSLDPGCYILRIEDKGDNGLEFWHVPNQGVGMFRILDANGGVLYTFDPDFGGFAQYEFGIGNITTVKDVDSPFVLSIYPNPTSDIVNINIKEFKGKKVAVSLTNSGMIEVFKRDEVINSEDFHSEIDMKNFPAGIYFLHIKYGDHSKMEKIIKY
jgi:concanavalin A-like lectin/glucanase superfamily protein/peptide-N-glycosidase F-like protein/type IX secretion system substrate protein